MMIKISDFREFKLGDIFDFPKIKKFSSRPENDGNIPYITSKSFNQGVDCYINTSCKINNVITISTNGACFDSFYHDEEISISSDVEIIRSNLMNKFSAMFVCTILNLEKKKWGYGRKPKNHSINNTIIKLPAKKNKDKWIPNWEYMENYVKNLFHNEPSLVDLFKRHNATKKIILNIDTWYKFKIGDIFDFPKIKKFSSRPKNDGNIPYITSKSFNQGVDCYISTSCKINNVITISTNGACFDSFYHDEEISISSDVEIIRSNLMNKFSAMFVCTILNLEKKKWGYGRKPKNHSINNTIIKLPAKKNKDKWEVDWKYMEDYIKSLPLSYKLGNH